MKLSKTQKAAIKKLESAKAELYKQADALKQLSAEWEAIMLKVREINGRIFDIRNPTWHDDPYTSIDGDVFSV